ncbi:primosomal protein N' [Aliidiomarina indica]|uniref:primosomal protein N' n=1 Tax=Aliidiomarina indica TaxID=2749147 RepID=UPI0018905DA5|nr:primosomal protein N' [Aliidiomarina indica]
MEDQQEQRCARVAVPVPMRRQFDYLLPADGADIAVGARVKVPFGSRSLIGFVTEPHVVTDTPPNKLKAIEHITDPSPLWPPSMWELLLWAAQYYHHPLGDVLAHAAPIALRHGEAPEFQQIKRYALTDEGAAVDLDSLKRAVQQRKIIAALRERALTSTDIKALELAPAALKTVQEKGWVSVAHEPLGVGAWRLERDEQPHPLNPEQAVAVAALHSGLAESEARVWLLEGVTGSGKTEVYLQAMEPVLARGQQVLVMVPEIGLTPQTVARFRARYKVPVVVMHSGLSDQERLQGWLQAREGHAAIIIGTRSSIFTPMKNLGLLIIDEEHDASFKQQDGFRYNARDLAIKRAHQEGFGVVLGSATPSLETLSNAQQGRYHHLQLKKRAGNAKPAKHFLLDLKQQRMQQGLSEQLISTMRKHLEQGNQVLLFLNRRGFANALICHECGWVAECRRCQANMTVHQHNHSLQCHHCGASQRIPRQCGGCGSTQLVSRGVGTEQLEQCIEQLFPAYSTVRIDRDSTRRKGQLESHLNAVSAGQHHILIGTQMLAKGHHFPNVTLVALLDVDGALYSADFRAAERLAQLYIQVAGRAGRASKVGTVVLQTHHPEHPLIQELVNNGYTDFARSALLERSQAMLPPYAAMALFRAEAMEKDAAEALLQAIVAVLEEDGTGEVTAIGPMPAPLARKAGRYRYQLMLHAASRAALHKLLLSKLSLIETLAQTRKARWSLDIDPQDFT